MNPILAAFFLGFSLDASEPGVPVPPSPPPDVVVLVHGLGRTHRSMRKVERALAAEGYDVLNLRYPSTKKSVEESAQLLAHAVEGIDRVSERRVHFVTHSLGGIVVRSYLSTHPAIRAGRVVMLAPPNGGSELADVLGRVALLRPFAGPPRGELGTGPDGIATRLPPVDFDLGVIAGNRSYNPLSLWVLPGQDDGVVCVERAKVEGMADFIVVPGTHSFIMTRRDVIGQAIAFLASGRFERSGA